MCSTAQGNVEMQIAAATLRLSRERPYLSAALWAVRRIATPQVPTMAVDKDWRLYYNPETVTGWSVEETAGVLYHEVCHLLRDHAGRGHFADDARAWNLACDAEINDDLKSEGVKLPGHPIFPATLNQPDGKLAEEYYHTLPTMKITIACACGSCATGQRQVWESADPSGALKPGEIALIIRSVAHAIRQENASGIGSVAGHWLRWAERQLGPPKVDWRQELSGLIRRALAETAGRTDYSYSRPAHRQGVVSGVIFPALREPEINVAVVVDTSGSIGDGLLGAALSEVAGVLKAAGKRQGVTVLAVDAAVQSCRKVFRVEQAEMRGGGGTNMGAGLAAAAKLKPRPEVAIVLTDGYTPWPESAPPMRTIVGLLDQRGTSPAWAKTVHIDINA